MITLDAVIYVLTLCLCISLGSYYKKIDNSVVRRNYGVGLGFICALLICRLGIIHTIFIIWGNIIIIKCSEKKFVHLLSLLFTWSYLIFIHYSYYDNEYIIFVNQIIALRLVGLAFEINITGRQGRVDPKISMLRYPGESDALSTDPTPTEIMSYALFFIGLHRGPYYRYKVFVDHFKTPFGNLGDCRVVTEYKLKKAGICALALFMLRLLFSSDAYYDDKFYEVHGSDYRYLYNIPQLVMFFLKSQALMLLSTSVSTECAFGMYPSSCQPAPGFGPSTNFLALKTSATSSEAAYEQEYNFEMLKCFSDTKVILGPKMRDSMRGWEMPTRYWFWAYTSRSLLKGNHEVRSAVAFLSWSLWRGPTTRQTIVSATLWTYVHLEKEYSELYETEGTMKQPWDIGFSVMRLLCLIYLTPCLVVTDSKVVLRYYNSVYWAFHIVLAVLLVTSVVLYKIHNKTPATVSVAPNRNNGRSSIVGQPSAARSERSLVPQNNNNNNAP